ncbi:unnamed protein product [Bursaphelenchus xylophilus]|uniref:(pine wood nematode) hypothetical protein n=1 Tax=Bursaphelenchus xylophilus TaxID=6326 RepID=A0A1I7RLV7_BURXY|nr:unnamed protein product [Bursaphelenchus xylophilus]CAG9106187.1 unnamed protein product [Bursaphelenchus xylophilus]
MRNSVNAVWGNGLILPARTLSDLTGETPRRDISRRKTLAAISPRGNFFKPAKAVVKKVAKKKEKDAEELKKDLEEPCTSSKQDPSQWESFLSWLDEYFNQVCDEGREDEFVDLKDFDKEKFNIGLEEVRALKRNAEKLVKAEDHTGISNIDIDKAVEAGALAFVDLHTMTRKRLRNLKRRISDPNLLYSPIPYEGSLKNYIEKCKSERENQIIETYVDFKTELKAKYDVLQRVGELIRRDNIQEMPGTKRLRYKRPDCKVDENLKTPENVCRTKNPLSYDLIMDDFLDFKAEEFIEHNRAVRRRTLARLNH